MADQFETVMMKHGEHGVQALLEIWERLNGVRHDQPLPLERRWELFLGQTAHLAHAVA